MDLERNELIYNLYFKDKLTVSEISKKVNLSISQISRILSKSSLYQQEKSNRKEENRKKHQEQAKEIMRKKRNKKQMEEKSELKEKVVAINRVAKVVKGGRTFRFSAVVVVGDENGHVGVGNGKAAEVPDAIKKAIQEAKKNLVEVPIVETTVPHEYVGTFGSAKVMLKPAVIGTGVIAGGSVRPVLELAGYKNIRTKVIGTNNPRNVVYATIEGLKSMQTIESVAKKRGKKVEEIL